MADKRELVLDVLMRDKTGSASKSTSRNIGEVADAADDAAKATERLGDESDRAEDQVGKLGRSSRTAAEHVEHLDREIESVEHELRQLAVAFTEAQTAAERADLSKTIRRTQRDLRELSKAKGFLGALLPKPAELASQAAEIGATTGKTFLSGFSRAAASAGPLTAVGAGMGLYLAPLLGATVSAGILGGVGAGGVIGGLALASRDSRVKSAAKKLGGEVLGELEESAGAFVPAALEGIDEIRDSFGDMKGDLRSIFDSTSGYVGPLVRGVTGLVEEVVDGAEKAAAGARPVIEALQNNLPELGDALGAVLEGIADDGPAAAVALEQVFTVLEAGIRGAGVTINALTEIYGFLASTGVLGSEAQLNWISYKAAADLAAGSTKQLGIEMNTAADATERQKNETKELENLLRGQVDPLFAFTEAQKKVTTAQENYNEAVKRFGPNSREAATAAGELATATIDLRTRANEAGAAADGTLTPAMRNALEAAGLTKGEIKGVETALRHARGELNKYNGLTATAHVEMETAEAQARLKRLKTWYDKFRNKQVTVEVFVAQSVLENNYRRGGDRMWRAEGGPVVAGRPYIVGEKRPEVFVPETNGYIQPSVGAFMNSASRMGGTSVATGTSRDSGWVVVHGDAVIDSLTQAIASRISAKGGRAAQLGIRFM